jgi:hypothetical protein
LKVTYTEEAVADIVEAITYLNERNPTPPRSWTQILRAVSNAWQLASSKGQFRDFAPAR